MLTSKALIKCLAIGMSDNGKNMKRLLTLIVFVFMSPSQAQEITINKGIYASYYHMAYQLDPETYTVNAGENFDKSGRFEVLVPKELFPVPAPYCPQDIMIRMPLSNNNIESKKLYDLLMKGNAKIDVVVELNPHFIGISTDPRELELLFCDVFFRHKLGDYHGEI
jgi:hypothetical protein